MNFQNSYKSIIYSIPTARLITVVPVSSHCAHGDGRRFPYSLFLAGALLLFPAMATAAQDDGQPGQASSRPSQAQLIIASLGAFGGRGSGQFSSASEAAPPSSAIKSTHEAISIDARHRSLRGVLQEIHVRSGAEVKVSPNLAGDVITRSVQEANWQDALRHLLLGYNYSVVWGKDGGPQQVFIYSRNQYAEDFESGETSKDAEAREKYVENLFTYESAPSELPQKYRQLKPGSVTPISLPAERMKQMGLGEKVDLNLPIGDYKVVHDNQFKHENGDITWVGYLEEAGKSYRVIITLGKEGTQGQVATPDGNYNLDFESGRSWLVESKALGS